MEAGKLRTASKVIIDGEPWTVLTYTLRPQSRGSAKMITKMKNLLNGQITEKTFQSSENMQEADVASGRAQYLYNAGEEYIFMDNETYDQFQFTGDQLGDQIKFFVENMEVSVIKWNGNVINVELPSTIEVEVTETDPGVKGDTASGGSKPATLETGAVIQVPFHINPGDKVVVNTQSGEYKERVKG